MSSLLNGSPLPTDRKERCFPCSASIGHTVKPFQGRWEPSQIRTPPYTEARERARLARVRVAHGETARHLPVKTGSRWRPTACSAHREMSVSTATRRVEFLDFQGRNNAAL